MQRATTAQGVARSLELLLGDPAGFTPSEHSQSGGDFRPASEPPADGPARDQRSVHPLARWAFSRLRNRPREDRLAVWRAADQLVPPP